MSDKGGRPTSSLVILLAVLSILSIIGWSVFYFGLRSYDSLMNEYTSLISAHKSLKQKYQELEQRLASLSLSHEALQRERGQLAAHLASLTARYRELEAIYRVLAEFRQALEADYEELESRLLKLRSDLAAASDRILMPADKLPSILSQARVDLRKMGMGFGEEGGAASKARKAMEWILINTQYMNDDYHCFFTESGS